MTDSTTPLKSSLRVPLFTGSSQFSLSYPATTLTLAPSIHWKHSVVFNAFIFICTGYLWRTTGQRCSTTSCNGRPSPSNRVPAILSVSFNPAGEVQAGKSLNSRGSVTSIHSCCDLRHLILWAECRLHAHVDIYWFSKEMMLSGWDVTCSAPSPVLSGLWWG